LAGNAILFSRCKATVQHLFVALVLSRADSLLAWRVARVWITGGTLERAGDSGDQSGCNRSV